MTIRALVRFDHGYHGHEKIFSKDTNIDHIIKHFETETDRANNTTGSFVLHADKVLENSDGVPQIDSDGNPILERIYLNKSYSDGISGV